MKDESVYLRHIRDAIRKIESYTAGGRKAFLLEPIGFLSLPLVTPNEGLSQQHLEEFGRSGIEAVSLVQDRAGGGIFGPRVKVIEIHKLAEEPSKEGKIFNVG